MQAGEYGPTGGRAPGDRLLSWLSVLLVLSAFLVVVAGRPAAPAAEGRSGNGADRSEPLRSDGRSARHSIELAQPPEGGFDSATAAIDARRTSAPARWCDKSLAPGHTAARDSAAAARPHAAVSRGTPPASKRSPAHARPTAHRQPAVGVHMVSTSVPCRPVPLPTCSPFSPLSKANAIASREGARTAQGSTDIPVSMLANSPSLRTGGCGGVSGSALGSLTWWYAEVPTAPG
jgi:hypothetical protein